jgi:hypothetical protein
VIAIKLLKLFLIMLALFLVVFIVYYFVFNNLQTQLITYGNIKVLDKALSIKELTKLDNEQLALVRNTIFAKYGYRFKSKNYQAHFGRFKWYKPKTDNVNRMLSDIDQYNIEVILQAEDRLNGKKGVDLIGIWKKDPTMAAGWGDHFHFFRDGHFRFDYGQAGRKDKTINMLGEWKIENNKLILLYMEKTVIEGGKLIDAGSSYEYIGGAEKKIPIIPPQKIEKKLGKMRMEYINSANRKEITIGDEKYWYFGGPYSHVGY